MKGDAYRCWLLNLLMVLLAFNAVDRLALGLLLQDIKTDLGLSDTELGLLSGIAFSLFYALLGVPIARWADRGNRVAIISACTALWCGAVALCGLAGSFIQLLLIRIGVAVGEAGCTPPAHSLIADHFNREERARAVARFMLGAPISVLMGYFLAGWLNELYGWRVTFVVLGLPGLVLAAIVWFTLKEPRLARAEGTESAAAPVPGRPRQLAAPEVDDEPSLLEVLVVLWANKTFRHLLLCFSVMAFFNYGIVKWQPSFFMRSYGFQTGKLGVWLAVIHGVGGIVGTYLGAELATRHAARNERLQLAVMAAAFGLFTIVSVSIYLVPNPYIAFALMGLAAIVVTTVNGPVFATIQLLVPGRMRATAIALIYLFANLIGMGLGPLLAGSLSDAFRGAYGEESLRYALLALSPGYLLGAWHLWCASRTVQRDLEAMEAGSGDFSEEGVQDGKGHPRERIVSRSPSAL